MASTQEVIDSHNMVVRNSGNFIPDIWEDYFSSFVLDTKLMETYNEEVGVLKKQVRAMVVAAGESGAQDETMTLIDTLERLGLSYHFEEEIEQLVEQTFICYDYKQDCNLFKVALHFRIFRQHGHKMLSDVFEKFKDGNGKFMEILSNDITGMLSLYEAAHLRTHGEDGDTLGEALCFTKMKLKYCLDMVPNVLSPSLEKQVRHALEQPLHRRMPRLEARNSIIAYQDYALKNENILRLAKFDFNRMQLLQKQELYDITSYWKQTGLVTEISYARHRPVEAYFWCATGYLESRFSLGRSILTKAFLIVTLVDDTYDSYGTFEELILLTDAIERWDSSACDGLPEYMKPLYKGLLRMYDEFDTELAKHGDMSHCVPYGKKAVKGMVRAYTIEVTMLKEGHFPTFDEYLAYALETSNNYVFRSSLIGLIDYATVQAFDWLFSKPKIASASVLIGRLLNDIAGYELKRRCKEGAPNRSPTGVECYMKQYKVSDKEAIYEIYNMIEDAWKDINEEILHFKPPTNVSDRLVKIILNFTRATHVMYRAKLDLLTNPERLEDNVRALYIDPIPI